MKLISQSNLTRLTAFLTLGLAMSFSACKEELTIQQTAAQDQAIEEGANYYPMAINDQPAYAINEKYGTDAQILASYQACYNAGFRTLRIEANPDKAPGGVVATAKKLVLKAKQAGFVSIILTYHRNDYMGQGAPSDAPAKAYTEFWDSMLDWMDQYNIKLGVNILNEWGDDNSNWINQYRSVIQNRFMTHNAFKSGMVSDIIIDAPNYAHDYINTYSSWKSICELDKGGRIAVGLHIYDFPVDGDYGYINSSRLKSIISKVGANNLIIGEIGSTFAAGVSSKDVPGNKFPTDFNLRDDLEKVASTAKSYRIPVIGWCWSGDGATKYKGGTINMNAYTNSEYRTWVKSLTY